MNNPIWIQAHQSTSTVFGDPRLVKRGRHCMNQFGPISPSIFAELAEIGLNKLPITVSWKILT